MLIVSLLVTINASKVIIKSGQINTPYVDVVSAIAEGNKLVITIKVVNEGGYNLTVLGGYVEIFNTGQRENITPTNSLVFNVSFPIISSLLSFNTIDVIGVVKGVMNGNPIYITFSVPTSINITAIIKVVNFTYNNNILNLYLDVENPVNITLIGIENLGVDNANLNEVVAAVHYIPLNLSLPAGVHLLNLSFNLKNFNGIIIEPSTKSPYYYYVSGFLETVLNTFPPQNKTYFLYYIRQF